MCMYVHVSYIKLHLKILDMIIWWTGSSAAKFEYCTIVLLFDDIVLHSYWHSAVRI